MKIKLYLALFSAFVITASIQAQNLSLVGQLSYPEVLNDIWGWTDPVGTEYALVGVRNGFSIVDVTTAPASPAELFFIEGPNSTWRDIKTWGDYAYVVHDNVDPGSPGAPGIGLLIVDLSSLPASIDTVVIKDFGSGVRFDHAHNIYIDEFGFLYIFGANYGAGGAIMLDLNADPEEPALAGVYNAQYIHDGFVRDNILWSAEINVGYFAKIDVSNKATPVILATQNTPSNFTHNVWLSDDDQTLFTTDEVSGGFIGSYDVSDPSDIQELDRWHSSPGSGVIPHNSFVLGDFLITSYYRDGVTIHDISRPGNLVLVGQYDTSPFDGFGFDGCWGVYPYAPSGRIFASDILTGLYVLDPNYTQAAWLEGSITNAATAATVPNATVELVGIPASTESDILGFYGTGTATAGTYEVKVTALGFVNKTISGVSLIPGSVTLLDIELEALPTVNFSGQITDAVTGNPVAGAEVALVNPEFTFETVADASGMFAFSNVYALSYQVIAGKWGYVSGAEEDLDLSTTTSWDAALQPGIYDDFTFDFGWTALGGTWAGGGWDRGASIVYDPGYGYPITPDGDLDSDPGRSCYVTGNEFAQDLVHAGEVILRSPEFDPRSLDRPTLRFSAWVFNTDLEGAISNDGLVVRLTDAVGTAILDTIVAQNTTDPQWVEYEYELNDFKDSGPAMRVLFTAKADGFPFIVEDILEAGVDNFRIEEFEQLSGLGDISSYPVKAFVYPNPVNDLASIQFGGPNYDRYNGKKLILSIYSITGKRIQNIAVRPDAGAIQFNSSEFAPGLYLFELKENDKRIASGKFSVVR